MFKPLPHRRNHQGFTLIELLLALGLMALFALLAYRGLDSVMRLHQGANEHQQKAQALDRALTQLEADLRQATSVQLLPAAPPATGLRLDIKRRANGNTVNINWSLEQQHWLRRASADINTSPSTKANSADSAVAGVLQTVQTADVLSPISSLEWLSWQANPDGWTVIMTNTTQNQTNNAFVLDKGLGLRLTVDGKNLEKLFLIGR